MCGEPLQQSSHGQMQVKWILDGAQQFCNLHKMQEGFCLYSTVFCDKIYVIYFIFPVSCIWQTDIYLTNTLQFTMHYIKYILWIAMLHINILIFQIDIFIFVFFLRSLALNLHQNTDNDRQFLQKGEGEELVVNLAPCWQIEHDLN